LTFYISAFLLLAGILLFFSSRLDRKWVFGLLFFLVAIFPSLPVIKAATKFIAADRYTYIPSIGIFYAASEFFARGFKQKSGHIFLLVVILVFATLAIETRQRTKVWQDSVALWSDVIAKYPRAWLAYVNRGESFDDKKEYKRALADYDAAIAINPGCATVYNNRAVSYYYLGEYDLSWRDIKKATAMGYLAHPGFIAALKKASGKAGVDGI
jgi:tetratricopeptide (TPR) repeat protein